ncbi:MAG: GMP synthase, partial [Mesorhizobium sp.]
AATIAERHPDWNDRLDDELAGNGPEADAAGLAIARAWVATI